MDNLEKETARAEEYGAAEVRDLAEQEFANYCEANGFDHDADGMDDEDRESFLKIKRRFVKAVKEARVIVDGTILVYTVSKFSGKEAGRKITVRRPVGRDFLAMDGYKETQQMNKFQAFVSSFCGRRSPLWPGSI
ncbi:MAG: hypothetical protein LBC88_03420 [Spirochaetaceae bacterium]|jgi:hypothetical protein|nr:hypothetical protein [Spirochaetaceae bacterium]